MHRACSTFSLQSLRAALVLALWVTGAWVQASWAQAVQPHRISPDKQVFQLTDAVWVHEDLTGLLSADEVSLIAQAGGMHAATRAKTSLPLRHPNAVVWLKFDLQPDLGTPTQWQLEVGRAMLNRVQLFTMAQPNVWIAMPELGTDVPFSARPFDHPLPVFPVTLEPGKPTSLLLRVQFGSAAAITAKLWQPSALQQSAMISLALNCLYFGLVAGSLVYNLLLYLVVRDKGFLLYCGCVGFTAIGFGAHSGLGAQFLWGEFTWWSSRALTIGWGVAAVFTTELARHFLQTASRLPVADKVLSFSGWILLAGVVVTVVMPPTYQGLILFPMGFMVPVLLTGLAILASIRRWPGAPYFLAAWVCLYVGYLVLQLRALGIVPDNIATSNAVAIGSAMQMILLSLALADRMNEERRQREKAQSITVGILQASNALSQETRLDRLHRQVCEVMAHMTRATTVRLLLWDAHLNDWFLCNSGDEIQRMALDDACGRDLVSREALREIERTRALVRIDDKTVMLPVMRQGALDAVLILQSASGPLYLTGDSLEAVNAVAGALAVSLENVLLYERLEQHVADRTRELRRAQQQLVSTARRAGMAEIANNVLHNVGNSLNTVNVAATLMRKELLDSRLPQLARAVELMKSRQGDLADFMVHDAKGQMLPKYLFDLSAELVRERAGLIEELERLRSSVEHINNVVAMQQSYAGASVFAEIVRPGEVFEDALRIATTGGVPLNVIREMGDLPPVQMDKSRTMQILVNLITNAQQAMEDPALAERTLTVRMQGDGDKLRFQVQDTGCGIREESLEHIFSHGYTTRAGGHGFGLHSCMLATAEMGGRLTVDSAGAGRGAAFTLEVPLVPATED